jgi:hypothetical protein
VQVNNACVCEAARNKKKETAPHGPAAMGTAAAPQPR